MKELEDLPDALKLLAVGKNPISTRERYNRLYKTLAARIPMMMKLLGSELDDYLPGQKQSLTLDRGEVGSASGEDQVGPMKFVRR